MENEQPTEIVRAINTVEVLEKIQGQLSAYNREPFRKELARFLCFSPSDEAIQAHANKSPDRWSQAVTILSKLSGITDKVEDASQSESIHKSQNLSMMGKRSIHNILTRETTTTGPRVLLGTHEIADYLRVHRVTAHRWIKKKRLPAAQGYKNKHFSTTSLIDCWIVTMRKIQLERKKANTTPS